MEFYRPAKTRLDHKQKFFRKLALFGALFAFLIFTTAAVYVIRYSSFFRIKKVEVSGFQSGSSEELVNNLKQFLASQSKIASFLGANNILIWKTDLESFSKEYPQFEILRIRKNYLSRQVSIEVKEREKFGVWCRISDSQQLRRNVGAPTESSEPTPQNSDVTVNSVAEQSSTTGQNLQQGIAGQATNDCFWFDKNGIVFSEAPTVEGELLNKVNEFSGRILKPGDRVLPENLAANLINIFEVMETAGLNAKTVNLEDLSLEEVYVNSISDPKIFFNLRINPEFALSAISALKNSGKWNKISYLDFRVENRAYYKFK